MSRSVDFGSTRQKPRFCLIPKKQQKTSSKLQCLLGEFQVLYTAKDLGVSVMDDDDDVLVCNPLQHHCQQRRPNNNKTTKQNKKPQSASQPARQQSARQSSAHNAQPTTTTTTPPPPPRPPKSWSKIVETTAQLLHVTYRHSTNTT